MALSFFTFNLERWTGWMQDLLHHADAELTAYLLTEHGEDGTHTAITAESARVTGQLTHGGPLILDSSAEITPPAIGANTNNYQPTNWRTAVFIRLSASAAYDITGFARQSDTGKTDVIARKLLVNVGNFDLTLKHNNAGSTNYNRISCPGSVDFVLNSADSVWIHYDTRSGIWRVEGW